MNDEIETCKLWRIRKTVFQLLHDRGYLISPAELDQTLEEFKQEFGDTPSDNKPARSDLTILVGHREEKDNQMIVFFCDEPKIGSKTVSIYFKRMGDEKISNGIIVAQLEMTTFAKRSLSDITVKYSKHRLESFLESELLINITRHELQPKFSILKPEEKKKLLEDLKLKESNLMRMRCADPIARYFGLKRGQVVKAVANSETAGRYISYRLVC